MPEAYSFLPERLREWPGDDWAFSSVSSGQTAASKVRMIMPSLLATGRLRFAVGLAKSVIVGTLATSRQNHEVVNS
jgi:hypothetical protein